MRNSLEELAELKLYATAKEINYQMKKSIDKDLELMFLYRNIIKKLPLPLKEKVEIDEFISDKGKEYLEKYEKMSAMELAERLNDISKKSLENLSKEEEE